MLLGFSGIIVQGMLIKPLTSWLGHKGILILGLVSTALSQLQFAVFKGTIPVVYANITVLLSLGLVTFPAVSSIKSINVTPKEQGQIQGALYVRVCTPAALSGCLGSTHRLLGLWYGDVVPGTAFASLREGSGRWFSPRCTSSSTSAAEACRISRRRRSTSACFC